MTSGMNYSVRIKRSAARELARVPKPDRQRLIQEIDGLAAQPLAGVALKGGLRGLRRIRVGNYRIVYEVRSNALVVLVVRIGHRRGVYRRRG